MSLKVIPATNLPEGAPLVLKAIAFRIVNGSRFAVEADLWMGPLSGARLCVRVARISPRHNIFDLFFGLYDEQNAKQKEQLFKLKLKIFEQDIVKNAKKDDRLKNAKTFIRKAKTPMEVLLGYMVFSNNAELKLDKKKKNEVEEIGSKSKWKHIK